MKLLSILKDMIGVRAEYKLIRAESMTINMGAAEIMLVKYIFREKYLYELYFGKGEVDRIWEMTSEELDLFITILQSLKEQSGT